MLSVSESLALVLVAFAFIPAVFIFKQREHAQTLRHQCDSLASSSVEWQEKVEKLEAQLEAMRKKTADIARNAKAKENAWNTKAMEIGNLKNRLEKMQTDGEQLQTRYRAGQDELRVTRTQRDELIKLVDAQALELTAAREFTFMTDKIAAADVIRMVHDLNSAIYQTAMQLISIIPPDSNASGFATDERLLAQTQSRSINVIGEQLLGLAASKGKDDESLSILAFHSGLAHVCSLAISSWLFGQVHESEVLKIVYEQIWVNEKQAVAGRWRSLTNKQLAGWNDKAIRHEILTVLICILFSIGWKDEPQNIQSALEADLGDSIDEVVTSVSRTSKMIREDFISEDLQVVYALPGQSFNASLMDVEEGASNVVGDVLGTMELGLAMRSRSGGQKLLLKPKVVINTYTS